MKNNIPISSPVDLTNLRAIIDGDVELEQELFDDYVNGVEEAIGILEVQYDNADGKIWKEKSHFLKGISRNLGAARMAEICALSEEMYDASQKEKTKILQDIENEYRIVKEHLLNECPR